jgi:hypothetical protein
MEIRDLICRQDRTNFSAWSFAFRAERCRIKSDALSERNKEGEGVGGTVAGRISGERKVRAPQDRVVGNTDRPKG